MTWHSLALVLAYVGATLGVTMVVPQIVRIVRHPWMGGVSPLAWSLTALACSTWLTYGIRVPIIPQIPGNVLLVSGAVAIVLIVPHRVSRGRRALALAAAVLVMQTAAWLVPATTVGYLAFCIGLFSAWPQVYESVTGRGKAAVSGVSIPAWSMRVVSQLCWFSYALIVGDVPVLISATVATSAAVLLVAVEATRRVAAQPEPLVLEPV